MSLLKLSLLSFAAASPMGPNLQSRQLAQQQQQQPYRPQNFQPQPNYQPAPNYQPQPNYQPLPNYLSQPNYQAQPNYPQRPNYAPQQQPKPVYLPQPNVQPRPAVQAPGTVVPSAPTPSSGFSNNWGTNPLGGLVSNGLEGLGTGLGNLIQGSGNMFGGSGSAAVPPATPVVSNPTTTGSSPAASSSSSGLSGWLSGLFSGGASSAAAPSPSVASPSPSASDSGGLSGWLSGIFGGGAKTTTDAATVKPAPEADTDVSTDNAQGIANFLDVTTASQDGVLCRRYPDNIISDPRNAMIFMEPTKIRVNCWSSPSIGGYYGSHHGDATWLLTTTGCYVNEMTVQDKVEYQKRLNYCVPPPHWVATVEQQYSRVDCYDDPSLNAMSKVVGSGPNVDLSCHQQGDNVAGNSTWYKHKDNNCFIPAPVFKPDGWYGTPGGKC